jgi:aconitate hydratase/homoaconitate hydratase
MTLTEKILFHHALGWKKDHVKPGDILTIAVDWTIASELAWNGMSQSYEALGRPPRLSEQTLRTAKCKGKAT